jgi:hypothetical protein
MMQRTNTKKLTTKVRFLRLISRNLDLKVKTAQNVLDSSPDEDGFCTLEIIDN